MIDGTENKRGHIAYTESELLLGLKMMDSLEKVTNMMSYFLDKQHIKFTYILICADDENFESFLRKEKRDTDLLIPIDKKQTLYAIVCQETDIEGGYRFAERIIRLLDISDHRECLHCSVLTVSSTRYSVQQIIFRLLESYLALAKRDAADRHMHIEFRTLS
ncbi:MAG: hypothetical protein U9R26_04895 [Campylobacterota bacterium]|nr:hypothetical protein [Campylobacterota bacterium]